MYKYCCNECRHLVKFNISEVEVNHSKKKKKIIFYNPQYFCSHHGELFEFFNRLNYI